MFCYKIADFRHTMEHLRAQNRTHEKGKTADYISSSLGSACKERGTDRNVVPR